MSSEKELSREFLLKMYKELYTSRAAQNAITNAGGRVVRDTGEEAIPVGTTFGVKDSDIISCYFRGDAANLRIRGAYSLRDHLAGWMYKKGEKNPMTFAYPNSWMDLDHGVIGTTSSLIGADAVICTGVALAQKLQKTGNIMLFLSGDGATSKGDFYEMMNFSKLNRLPIIIFIRNNNYAMSTTMDRNIAVEDFSDLPNLFKIPYKKIDGNDIIEVQQATAEAAEIVRNEGGPYIIIAKTFRMAPHTIDDGDEYRRDVDRSYWIEHDPILIAEKRMKEEWGISESEISDIRESSDKEILEAMEWVMSRPSIEVEDVTKSQKSVVAKMWREE